MIEFSRDETMIRKKLTIKSLKDNRLVKIDPQTKGFFDAVLNFKTSDENIKLFIEAIKNVKAAELKAFYKPIYDPSVELLRETTVFYKKGYRPALFKEYNWWRIVVSKMPMVGDKKWGFGSTYQYNAFLVYIVNKKIALGEKTADVLQEVVNDSTTLGHYSNSKNSTQETAPELTGSRCVCGIYDLGNVHKLLIGSDKEIDGFWLAGGSLFEKGYSKPLANLEHYEHQPSIMELWVPMLVLK